MMPIFGPYHDVPVALEVYDDSDRQICVYDAVNVRFSSHYGESGSGFGYLSLSLPREVGNEYRDIGFGYRVKARMYLNTILFDGQMRPIEEVSSPAGDAINVTAIGWATVFEDDEILRAFCDTRLDGWRILSELPKGNFAPDLYATGHNDCGLFMHPNNDEWIAVDKYTYLIYQFYPGDDAAGNTEEAKRIKCDVSTVLGAGTIMHGDIHVAFRSTVDTVTPPDEITYGAVTDGDENNIGNGDILENTTQGLVATINTVNVLTNTITFSDGDVSSWANGDVIRVVFHDDELWYDGDAGDTVVEVGMVLYNMTAGKQAEVSAMDAANDKITVTDADDLDGWTEDDEIIVVGPLFRAQITDITGAVVTYDGTTEVGEGNLAVGQVLANVSKKSIAEVQASNAGANTVTITDSDHVSCWEEDDIIMVGTSLFRATIDAIANDGDGTGAVSWQAGTMVGASVVDDDTGWTLYNPSRANPYATVDTWDVASRKVGVDDWNDIDGGVDPWVNGDIIYIYTPFRLAICDIDWNVLWPSGDIREGAIPHNRTSVNETVAGSHDGFLVACVNEVYGKYDETTFVQLSDLRVYSVTDDATATELAEYISSILSVSGHGLSSSTDDIESIANVVEPMFFEFMTPKAAMEQVCQFGDGSGNLLAWGVRLDDSKTIFLETQDLDEIDYVVRRTGSVDATASGDIQQSVQRARAIYTDKTGKQQVGNWRGSSGHYFGAGYFRAQSVRLDSVDNLTDAEALVDLFLADNREEKRASNYVVGEGSVFTPEGVPIPIAELKATGGLVLIEDWRAVESGLSGSDLRSWTVEQIVAVEVDLEAGTATLTPAAAVSSFERYMAELARLAT